MRVIGVGHPAAGDDSVGINVVRLLRQAPLNDAVELFEIADPARLVDLLDGHRQVIIVDAAVTPETPGTILHLTPERLAGQNGIALSSHGTSVSQAIGLARALNPETTASTIDIVAIAITAPGLYTEELTPALQAALPDIVQWIKDLIWWRLFGEG